MAKKTIVAFDFRVRNVKCRKNGYAPSTHNVDIDITAIYDDGTSEELDSLYIAEGDTKRVNGKE